MIYHLLSCYVGTEWKIVSVPQLDSLFLLLSLTPFWASPAWSFMTGIAGAVLRCYSPRNSFIHDEGGVIITSGLPKHCCQQLGLWDLLLQWQSTSPCSSEAGTTALFF